MTDGDARPYGPYLYSGPWPPRGPVTMPDGHERELYDAHERGWREGVEVTRERIVASLREEALRMAESSHVFAYEWSEALDYAADFIQTGKDADEQ